MTPARLAQALAAGLLLALALWGTGRALAPAHVAARVTPTSEGETRGVPTRAADPSRDGAGEGRGGGLATTPGAVISAGATGGTTSERRGSAGAVAGGSQGQATQPASAVATAPAGPAMRLADDHDEPVPEHVQRALGRVAINPSGSPFGEMGCAQQRAFTAGALHFSDPTPEPLRAALEAATRGGHAISLVLRKDGDDFLASFGATLPGPGGKEAFVPGKTPSSVPLVPAFGEPPGISSNLIVERGYLLVSPGKAPVVLELRSLVWRASKGASCDRMSVDVRGLVPLSQSTIPLPGPAGSSTIAELLGVAVPPGGPVEGDAPGAGQVSLANVHFAFEATALSFDFGTP